MLELEEDFNKWNLLLLVNGHQSLTSHSIHENSISFSMTKDIRGVFLFVLETRWRRQEALHYMKGTKKGEI